MCIRDRHWEWSDDVDWEPRVKMAMSSETANKYFQGKENVAMAIARRRIKSGGDVKAALALMPITKPVFAQYRAMLEQVGHHLTMPKRKRRDFQRRPRRRAGNAARCLGRRRS